jgi:hypothetical protein
MLRAFWVILCLVHLAPLTILTLRCAAEPTPTVFISLLSLLLVTGLFALKAFDAPFLRLNSPVVEIVIIALFTAMAHGGAVGESPRAILPAEVASVAMAASFGAAVGSRNTSVDRLVQLLRSRPDAHPGSLHNPDDLHAPISRVSGGNILCLGPPRSPPFARLF